MAKIVGYRCVKCGHKDEELYNDSERKLKTLKRKCPKCGGNLQKWNTKDNIHRWSFNDRGGL